MTNTGNNWGKGNPKFVYYVAECTCGNTASVKLKDGQKGIRIRCGDCETIHYTTEKEPVLA